MEYFKVKENSPDRDKQESTRFETLVLTYGKFISSFVNDLTKENVCLNKGLLLGVVHSYFDDIERFKNYAAAERADRHKQAAYTIKWIAKFKPIQIKIDTEDDRIYDFQEDNLLIINSYFAIYAGIMLFLDRRIFSLMSKKVLDHLMYDTLYRNISGRQLATTLYMMEKIVECYYRDPVEPFEI